MAKEKEKWTQAQIVLSCQGKEKVDQMVSIFLDNYACCHTKIKDAN